MWWQLQLLRRLRQENSQFEASLEYKVRSYLKKPQRQQQKNPNKKLPDNNKNLD
jgi:hypothetical protein